MSNRMRGNQDPRRLAAIRWEKAKKPPDDEEAIDREYREALDEFLSRYGWDDERLDPVVARMLNAMLAIWARDQETIDYGEKFARPRRTQ